jgi:hypothetical protein
MTSQVVGSDFTSAAQLPNFVNGRVLTAADLSTSQQTLRVRDTQVGQAAGSGVVQGLWVTGTATTLTVATGLAIARSGEPVTVGTSVTLPLTLIQEAAAVSRATFSCCTPAGSAGATSIAVGCYLLTALPACQLQGQSPVGMAPGTTTASGCAAAWLVEGVSFKAIPLPVGATVDSVTVDDDNRRNLLAHWCLGSEQFASLAVDPFSFDAAYSGLDTLDPADLTPDDVPLAVFYWDGQSVGFVDNWSARRRVTAPDPVGSPWSALTGDRRLADGHARFLQFQDQAADLVSAGSASGTVATDAFPLLPPVGFLQASAQSQAEMVKRLRDVSTKDAEATFSTNHEDVLRSLAAGNQLTLERFGRNLEETAPQLGFDPWDFFGDAADFGGYLDWDIVEFALRQSWTQSPALAANSANDDNETGDVEPSILFFGVSQNLAARIAARFDDTGLLWSGSASPEYYVVFIKCGTWIEGTQLPFNVVRGPFRVEHELRDQ